MPTTINRGATWTNPDGLVVGFGKNLPVKEGSTQKNDGAVKTSSVTFSYDNMSSANVPVAAGSTILEVKLKVHTAFAGGTSLTVGDGSSAIGFITATAGALANLIADAVIQADGLYAFGGTDTTARELKKYTTADTIDLAVNGTFTAGVATLEVVYI